MSAARAVAPLDRRSAVDALVEALRGRILDASLAPGVRLPEQELSATYGVARHTTRAALRALAAEGLVTIAPNRGARVTALGPADVEGLYELRAALELEAARLALARHGSRLPGEVHAAVRRLSAVCARRRPAWGTIVDAHDDVHTALVAASLSPRIVAAHAALAGETRLFLVQLRPRWTPERMAADHERLVAALEAAGAEPLRAHLAESAEAVLGLLRGS